MIDCTYRFRHERALRSSRSCSRGGCCTASSHQDRSWVVFGKWSSYHRPSCASSKYSCSCFSMLYHTLHITDTHGGCLLSLIPTASNSASSRALCSALFVASKIIKIMSLVYRMSVRKPNTTQLRKPAFAALMTCLPRPLPSAAPSMIPGRSRIWISAPPYSSTPGMAVSVVKAYAATTDFVFVIFPMNVDFPTLSKKA